MKKLYIWTMMMVCGIEGITANPNNNLNNNEDKIILKEMLDNLIPNIAIAYNPGILKGVNQQEEMVPMSRLEIILAEHKQEMQKERAKHEQKIATMIADNNQKLADKDKQLEEKNKQLEEKNKQLADKDVIIQNLVNQLKENNQKLAEKDKQLKDQNEEIKNLKELLNIDQLKVLDKEGLLGLNQKELSRLKEVLKKKDNQLEIEVKEKTKRGIPWKTIIVGGIVIAVVGGVGYHYLSKEVVRRIIGEWIFKNLTSENIDKFMKRLTEILKENKK